MKLRIGKKIINDWKKLLNEAGKFETGGILFGEHLGNSDFRVVKITNQASKGSHNYFRRDASEAIKNLKKLNLEYESQYEKFNYLGEWHSHPNDPPLPSPRDNATMHHLLSEPDSLINFLVLIIVKLTDNVLELSASTYLASGQTTPCKVIVEG